MNYTIKLVFQERTWRKCGNTFGHFQPFSRYTIADESSAIAYSAILHNTSCGYAERYIIRLYKGNTAPEYYKEYRNEIKKERADKKKCIADLFYDSVSSDQSSVDCPEEYADVFKALLLYCHMMDTEGNIGDEDVFYSFSPPPPIAYDTVEQGKKARWMSEDKWVSVVLMNLDSGELGVSPHIEIEKIRHIERTLRSVKKERREKKRQEKLSAKEAIRKIISGGGKQ